MKFHRYYDKNWGTVRKSFVWFHAFDMRGELRPYIKVNTLQAYNITTRKSGTQKSSASWMISNSIVTVMKKGGFSRR